MVTQRASGPASLCWSVLIVPAIVVPRFWCPVTGLHVHPPFLRSRSGFMPRAYANTLVDRVYERAVPQTFPVVSPIWGRAASRGRGYTPCAILPAERALIMDGGHV